MGKFDARIKRAMIAIADACDDDPELFCKVMLSEPQPWLNGDVFDRILDEFELDKGLELRSGITVKSAARGIGRELVELLGSDTRDEYDDLDEEEDDAAILTTWLEDVVERIPGIKSKLDRSYQKLGAEDPNELLGRFAFARDRVNRGKIPDEPDTKDEEKLKMTLRRHFNANAPIPTQTGATLAKFLKAGKYSDVIHEPTNKTLYRGIAVTKAVMRQLIGGTKPILDKGRHERKVKLKPKRGVASSWTSKRAVAQQFAMDSVDEKRPYGVILLASPDDNSGRFVAGPNGLYKVEDFAGIEEESESVGLGPITIREFQWWRDREY